MIRNLVYMLVLCIGLLSGSSIAGEWATEVENDIESFANHNLSEVQYLLWTRSNMEDENYYVLEVEDEDNLLSSPFDAFKRTHFMFHGYSGNGEEDWILRTKTNLLSIQDVNVISVDYRTLVASLNYEAAVKNMILVANMTASYIDWLTQVTSLLTSNIHITGHSLGGQCAGLTAQYVTAGIVDRVTGLDPAGPLFYNKDDDGRIDKSDASFVDIIHSNSGPLYSGCVGLNRSLGHVDFFPNGGSHQPGCTIPGNVTGENIIDLFTGCSHARSHEFWIESILAGTEGGTGLTFVAWPCTDWLTYEAGGCPDCGQGCLEMGFHVDRSLEGNYYLSTRSFSPYAKGDSQTKVT